MFEPKAYIHLDRLAENFRLIRELVGGRRLMTVVKANAYGHGAVETARALKQAGSDYFAVFTVGEGVELRQAGIRDEILVFSRLTWETLPVAAEYDLTQNISWPDDLEILREYQHQSGRCPRVHLKVDTGMTRLGVPLESAKGLLEELARSPEVPVEGIYSHFATADEGDLSYAYRQLEQFKTCLRWAESLGLHFKQVHFSNSGAVLNLPEAWFDLVRVGLILYGAFPSEEVPRDLPIRPVLEFRAPIVTVREVAAGTPVSYGGVFAPVRDTTIGVIQAGFADGFPRPWYQMGVVGYRGRRFRIAGRICMDQFMVDFEGRHPPVGDEVLLFGESPTESIRSEEIAQATGTTPYVLLTAVGGRTRRIFV